MDTARIRLTELSACAGCAAKLGSAELHEVLGRVRTAVPDPRVLVSYGTGDDAGVFLVNEHVALVQTVDFFTPIVDDPFDFGRIAATNALSDVYAMGGTPLCALNIVGFPEDLDSRIRSQILDGGAAVAARAGMSIVGGHTIKDPEPKYGMAVTGVVDPARVVTNANAQAGDVLVLTKPIGTGILTTARKRDAISDDDLSEAIAWMTTLNASASEAMQNNGAHAATDVTGFGLLGHAGAMAAASGVAFSIDAGAVPYMAKVRDLIADGVIPGGTRHNAETHAGFTTFETGVDAVTRIGLSDAQTSGGLLIAVERSRAEALCAQLSAAGLCGAVVGSVRAGSGLFVR
ncbi:MAG: selenide, water dikinase SelD [Candidatus Eremiobacteraeota bacterium]|nr:selenide, water dikinase SelD [Candidatus Eremiobacteraeota bacterium]